MRRANLWVHFLHRHVWDKIVILEEGNCHHHHPRCPKCDMFVPWTAFNWRHSDTDLCERGSDKKLRRMEEKEAREGAALAFNAYGQPL